MTQCSTYIGDLTHPDFRIDEVLTINLPRHLFKSFPSPREHYNRLFHDWVKLRALPCKQIDYNGYLTLFGTWTADPSANDAVDDHLLTKSSFSSTTVL